MNNNRTRYIDTFYAEKFIIYLYSLLCIFSSLSLLLFGEYSGDFLGAHFLIDYENIAILITISILQIVVLFGQRCIKISNSFTDIDLVLLRNIIHIGVLLMAMGVYFFGYGVAGAYSDIQLGFVFKLIPVGVIIYFYIFFYFNKYGSFPYVTIVFYILVKMLSGWTGIIFYLLLFCICLNFKKLVTPRNVLFVFIFTLLLIPLYYLKIYIRGDVVALANLDSMSFIEGYVFVLSKYIYRLAYFQNNFFVIERLNELNSILYNNLDFIWYIKEFFGSFLPKGFLGLKIFTLENFIPLLLGYNLDYGVSFIAGLFSKLLYLFVYFKLSFCFFLAFMIFILISMRYMLDFIFGFYSRFIFVFIVTPFLVHGHFGYLGESFYGVMFMLVIFLFSSPKRCFDFNLFSSG